MATITALEPHRLEIPESPAESPRDATVKPAEPAPTDPAPEEEAGGFYYIPNFLTDDDERYLIDKIATAPLPKWKTLQNRRLQYWGGQVQRETLVPEALPSFMTTYPPLISRIKATGVFAKSKHGEPNHCLVNEYLPGQGIMPHEDGAAYFPCVATVSIGSHTLLDIYEWAEGESGKDGARARQADPSFSILQERRSLLITTGAAYRKYLHGIAERTADDAVHLTKVINGDQLGDEGMRRAVQDVRAGSSVVSLPRQTRYSLTLRDVTKVSKGLGALLGGRR